MLNEIYTLLSIQGKSQYGDEAVSQLEHALQCAMLAEQSAVGAPLVVACLLHDIGHLLHNLGETVARRGLDDRHEYRGVSLLKSIFPETITEPIRLHVDAKRYLCATESGYWDRLSEASQQSLILQGGVFSLRQVELFEKMVHAPAAIQLRRWDDRAKVKDLPTPSLEHFWAFVQQCQLT